MRRHRQGTRAALAAVMMLAVLAGCQHGVPKAHTPEQRSVLARGDVEQITAVAAQLQLQGDWTALHWLEYGSRRVPSSHLTTRLEVELGQIFASGRTDPSASPSPRALASARRPQPRKALHWFTRAAYHGSPYAFADLRRWHGEHGPTLLELRWQLRGAVYHRSLYRLPRVRQDAQQPGTGAVDPQQYAHWQALIAPLQQAAAAGDSEAQVDLGALYEGGVGGLPRDPAQALLLYQRAANQGNVFGQYFAGLLLGRGAPGVPKNADAAAPWFARAHAQHFYLAAPSYWQEAIKPIVFNFSS